MGILVYRSVFLISAAAPDNAPENPWNSCFHSASKPSWSFSKLRKFGSIPVSILIFKVLHIFGWGQTRSHGSFVLTVRAGLECALLSLKLDSLIWWYPQFLFSHQKIIRFNKPNTGFANSRIWNSGIIYSKFYPVRSLWRPIPIYNLETRPKCPQRHHRNRLVVKVAGERFRWSNPVALVVGWWIPGVLTNYRQFASFQSGWLWGKIPLT